MHKKYITFPRKDGTHSRQAHTKLPEGTYEREMGKEGFFGPVTHLYHTNPPTRWSAIDGPLRPQAFDTTKLDHDSTSPWQQKILLHNAACQIGMWQTDKPMTKLARNADGDTLLFVHDGSGDLFCDFGHMTYRKGEYILLPRGTMWRLTPTSTTTALIIEATNNSFGLPEKGLLGEQGIFDPDVLDIPELNDIFKDQQNNDAWQIEVKRQNQITTITYPYNPLDAVGWKGNLTVCKLHWEDICPVMSHRYHIPPSVHTTFLTDRFVVCTFVPRPIESDPDALKVPFFHNNDDYDEFLFYHEGKFFSRDNIHPGMCTFHPSGVTHGPHPNSLKNAENLSGKISNEVAVMVDTRDPLNVTDTARRVEWEGYVDSWKE